MEAADNGLLETKYEYTLLFDFYGALLKDKNYSIFEDYVCNDMSLSEIAEEQGITRQGVRDTVRRSLNKLIECEEKLGLIKRFDEAKNSVGVIKKQVAEVRGLFTDREVSDTCVLPDNVKNEHNDKTECVTDDTVQTSCCIKEEILQHLNIIEQMADGIVDNM